MRGRGEKKSKKGFGAALAAMTVLLTGCTQVTAGTSPPAEIQQAGQQAHVNYFNGDTVKGAEARVSGGIPVWEMKNSPDISLMPENDVCTVTCFHIQTTDPDIRPIQAVMEDGSVMNYMGTEYDGAGYPIGNGWYAFLIPNGLEEYAIRVGDTALKPAAMEDN